MACVICSVLNGVVGFGGEPAPEFLRQLRARGYFDMAHAYLDRLEQRGAVPEGFVARIPFERAITELEQALQQQDSTQRALKLQRAQQLLEQFLSAGAEGQDLTEAQSWRQKILLELARGLIARARGSAADETSLREQARQLYRQAADAYEQRLVEVRQALEALATQPPDQQDAARREQWRAEYLELKLIVATIQYELADTLTPSSDAYRQQLARAAEVFQELAEKYRTRLVGQQAILLQGKCYQRGGDPQQALTYFEELLNPEGQPEPVRRLSAQAATGTIECLADPALNQLERAAQIGTEWLQKAGSLPAEPLEYQDLRLAFARVLAQQAQQEKNRRYLTEARKQILPISRTAGPRQREARELLVAWKGDEAPEASTDVQTVNTYAEARLAGDEAREAVQSAEMVARVVEPRLAAAASDTQRAELQQELDEAREQMTAFRLQAIVYYQRALELAPPDTPLDDLNAARYYLCYLFYGAERLHEAAVLGEHLARRFPDAAQARPAANITLAALLQLVDRAAGDAQHEVSSRHILRIADYIATRWPEQKEAQDALLTLVSFMLRQGELAAAQEYLRKIPSDSPRRGEAELRSGQAIWASVLRDRQAVGTTGLPAEDADPRVEEAIELMSQGLQRMSQGSITSILVQAALSLAQIYVETDQPQLAISLLEHELYGPHRLVEQQHPLTQTEGFAAAVVRTMLRAQLGQVAQATNDSASVEPLRETMRRLEASLAGTPDAAQRLLATYMGLAAELKGQLPRMSPQQRERLAAAFEAFLQEVLQAADANHDADAKHWVAETYLEVADALESGGGPPLAVSKQYRQQAADVWQQMLNQDPGDSRQSEDERTHFRLRRAAALRHSGQFDAALDEFEQVLLRRNNLLNVQIDAAETMQAAGEAGREGMYLQAIKGARRNNNTGQNTFWGWERIARVTLQQMRRSSELRDQFADSYFTAQWNIPRCRFGMAQRASGDTRIKYLQAARTFIEFTAGAYPDLGGPEFRDRFDQLMKDIQQALGEAPTGLPPAEGR